MPWTPARAVGALLFVGLTAGGALALSAWRVDPGPLPVIAGATTTAKAPPEGGPTTTAAPPAPTTTTSTPEPPLTGPVRLNASSRFDLRGVGPVEAGMTVHQAEEATGLRFGLTAMPATNGRCSSAAPAGIAGLTFVIVAPGGATAGDPKAGTVARGSATDAAFATVSGARVAMTIDEARRLYAGRYEEVRFGRGGIALTIRGRSEADRDFGVRIESTDGRAVTSVSSGRSASLAAPDGCA